MNIYLGADHHGFELKNELLAWLEGEGHTVTDCGDIHMEPTDDYVDFSVIVAQKVRNDPHAFGILLCGSGIGVSIAANRFHKIRAALCISPEHAAHARTNDHCNVLCLASDMIDTQRTHEIISAFLTAQPNMDPKYIRRIEKLDLISNE